MPAEGKLHLSTSSTAEDVFMPRVVIFANGQLPDLEAARALLQDDDYIVAADGGGFSPADENLSRFSPSKN